MSAFFLDEDIPLDLGALLARAGHHVTTTRDVQRYGSSDPSQLLYATVTGAIIVTHNGRHFWNLHIAWLAWPLPYAHEGIIALAGVHGKPSEEYFAEIAGLLATPDFAWANRYWFWDRRTGWRATFE